jgi:hypothetical protein
MNIHWGDWSRGQWALRLLVVLGPVVALLAQWPSLGPPQPWLVGLTLVLAAGWALVPESVVGGVVLLLVAFSWVNGLEHRLPLGALVAAAGLLASHLAALVASYGPARLPVSAPVARLWARRGVLLFLSAPAVWLLAWGVRRLPDSGSVWVLGLVVALSVVVVAAAASQAALPKERE